jgi:hypothetical protein
MPSLYRPQPHGIGSPFFVHLHHILQVRNNYGCAARLISVEVVTIAIYKLCVSCWDSFRVYFW